MTIGYDKIDVNRGLLLDLPFDEGKGVLVHDRAKPQRILTQQLPGGGSFAWGNLITGCPYLEFVTIGLAPGDGVYLECPAADTLDLDFTSGDYSIGAWVNHGITGNMKPKILIGRYQIDDTVLLNNTGWEVYLETNAGIDYLELRHHHGSLGVDPDHRDGCYSKGWATNRWDLLGISRHKVAGTSYPQHYRNGVAVETTYTATGLRDPDSCGQDLVIGSRFTKDQDWFKGKQPKMKIWGRALAAEEWRFLFNCGEHWFN